MSARAFRLGLLLAAPVLLAAAPPSRPDVPLPPTPAGSAPGWVLDHPVRPHGAEEQTVHVGDAVDPAWWHRFNSPVIDDLVQRALAANTDLAQAEAALRQAGHLAGAARGVLWPQVDAGYNVERERLSRNLSTPLANPDPTLFTIHTAQVSVSYTLDLFGGNRARVASAKAAESAARARMQAMRNMVIGNVILAVIQNAGLEAQGEAARASLQNNRELLDLLRKREQFGAVGKADVAAQEAALAASEGVLPPIERAQADNRGALAVLLGLAPGAPLPDLPSLDAIALPGDLPLSLPSDLVAQRPDIAASAAALDGAAADARAAIAARLPSITLSAAAGGSAQNFSDLFVNGNPFWNLIGGITAPVFHGGTLLKQQRAAQDALDGAKAAYRGTVLAAFTDVSNALTAVAIDGHAIEAAQRGDSAAQQSLTFIRRQLELGSVGTFALLNASATAAQARQQYVLMRSQRLSDTVGLFVALGGGTITPAAPPK